jgi:hypothetical protein
MSRVMCTINVLCCDSKEHSIALIDVSVLTVFHRYPHNGQYCAAKQLMIRNWVGLSYVVNMVLSDVSDGPPL